MILRISLNNFVELSPASLLPTSTSGSASVPSSKLTSNVKLTSVCYLGCLHINLFDPFIDELVPICWWKGEGLKEDLSSYIFNCHRWQIWRTRTRRSCTSLAVEDRDQPCACYVTVSRSPRWPWASCLVIQMPYGPWKGESMVSRFLPESFACFHLNCLLGRSARFWSAADRYDSRLFSTHVSLYHFFQKSCVCNSARRCGKKKFRLCSQKLNVSQIHFLLSYSSFVRKNVWMRKWLNGSKFEQSFGVREHLLL